MKNILLSLYEGVRVYYMFQISYIHHQVLRGGGLYIENIYYKLSIVISSIVKVDNLRYEKCNKLYEISHEKDMK